MAGGGTGAHRGTWARGPRGLCGRKDGPIGPIGTVVRRRARECVWATVLESKILGLRTVEPSRHPWGQMGDPRTAVETFVSDCAGPKTTALWWTRSSESRATENRASMRERVSETGEARGCCPGTSLRLSGSLCSVPATSCLPLRIARVRRKAIRVRIRLPHIPSLPRPCRVSILVGHASAGGSRKARPCRVVRP